MRHSCNTHFNGSNRGASITASQPPRSPLWRLYEEGGVETSMLSSARTVTREGLTQRHSTSAKAWSGRGRPLSGLQGDTVGLEGNWLLTTEQQRDSITGGLRPELQLKGAWDQSRSAVGSPGCCMQGMKATRSLLTTGANPSTPREMSRATSRAAEWARDQTLCGPKVQYFP